MFCVCEFIGIGFMVGYNVSYLNIKIKCWFMLNLVNVMLYFEVFDQCFLMCVVVKVLCIVDKFGGLDVYLVKVKDEVFFDKVFKIKKNIVKCVVEEV